MRLKEKLNYSGRTQDFTATIRALLGRINLAYGAPEFCYGHCSAGSHFRKGVPSLIKLSSTKFGNISKSTLDIEKIQRNLGIPIKEHVEYIYDSAYFEELFKHLSDPEYTKFFKIYVSLEFLVTIGQNLPTSEQRTYLSQNDVYRDSISRCVYHLENVIMWPESAFAAGLAILFFQNFQNNDGIAMEEDFKYVTETLLKRVKEHLERTNQSAEFVENLGFLFLPSGHIYRVLLNFVTLVQQNIASVVDLNVPQNQTRSYFIHLLDAYRVNGLGKILWLTNKDKVVIETSSQVGVTKRKRVMLEPPYAFFPYTDHVETGKKVSPTDEYGERERPWKIHYHCGMHVLQAGGHCKKSRREFCMIFSYLELRVICLQFCLLQSDVALNLELRYTQPRHQKCVGDKCRKQRILKHIGCIVSHWKYLTKYARVDITISSYIASI